MCATIVWAINASAYSADFLHFTTDSLGRAPQQTVFHIKSTRVHHRVESEPRSTT